MEPVRWGVLSTAKIGLTKVVPAMLKGRATRVVALASRDRERGEAAARALGIATVHGSYEALLADPEVEVVYNPLPNHLHVPWTIRAMEAGKDVLCEKPVALDAAEAGLLLDAQARTGRRVGEAFMVRHHPQWLRARALLAEGAVGEPRLIRTAFAYRLTDPANIRNRADIGGGGLYDIGCYAIATARFLFAAEPVRAVASVERDPALGVDRLTSGLLDFPGGRQLVFSTATQLAARQHVEVLGTAGCLAIEVPFNDDPARPTRLVLDDGRDLYGGGARVEEVPPCDQYTEQADAFSEAIRGGTPLPYPIEDAVANARALDALRRSEASGRWETP